MQISWGNVQIQIGILVSLVTLLVTLGKFLYKCVTIENIDKVFFSKEKQWSISLGRRILVILWYSIAFFAIGFCNPNEKLASRTVIYIVLIVLIILLIIRIYLKIAQNNGKTKKFLKLEEKWRFIISFSLYYVVLFICEVIIENSVYATRPNIHFLGRIVFSIILSVCFFEICVDFLLNIEKIINRTMVYIEHEQYGTLILLYAVDKNTMLCKVDGEEETYVRVLKEDLTNVKIHVKTEKLQ